ncbi:hypothetical protein CHS0354_033291 [Potamilus streckersoni]|uniref:IgGFc-binding protein N-terminal domain-containing protein n=1 Tax=Potamilus streckersoni TaxID=2493646 RepID=A0AAE0VIL7_9BIVA|nr:hypothetical protein CHS0354_033291 [Potamilus streckersoni]
MEYQRKYVVVLFMLTLTSYVYAEHIIDVELETIKIHRPWTGIRTVYRQNASGGGSLHLYENDAIIIRLCPDQPMFVSIEKVSYSNDGMSDTLQLLENQNFLGRFSTYQHSNWGQYWDDFLSSGPLGEFNVQAQPINVTLFVTYADCFGVELDKIVLKVNKFVDQSFFICGYDLVEGPKKSECMPPELKNTDATQISSEMQTTTITSVTVATESLSIMKPIVTTKQDYVVSSADIYMREYQQPVASDVMIKQKSSKSNCLDRKNIHVEFSMLNIVGTVIVSRTENVLDTSIHDNSTQENTANTCDNVIWRLGYPDNSGREFSSIVPDNDVEFTIVEEIAEAKNFPGVIQTDKTHKIVIYYTLGYNKQLESGSSVLFTLGLANLTKNINVGVDYHHRGKKDTKIYTNVLSSKLPVRGWVIPARTISPSLENQIHIYFPNASDVPIEIDFMRLDYIKNSTRSRNVLLHEDHIYRIRGAQYIMKSNVNDMIKEGMDVIIGKKTTSNIEKLIMYHRPITKDKYSVILTINENGDFFPYHENQQGNSKTLTGQELVDVSGLIFAGVDGTGKLAVNPISRLEINPSNMDINVTYDDGSTLRLLVLSTTTDTQIVVSEARFRGSVKSSVSFVSTYVSDYIAAVNQINVDGLRIVPVLSEEINNIKGSIFTFQKTSPILLYKTGEVIEIRFCTPCFQ